MHKTQRNVQATGPHTISASRRVAILLHRNRAYPGSPPVHRDKHTSSCAAPGPTSTHTSVQCCDGPVRKAELFSILYDPVLDLDNDGFVSAFDIEMLWAALSRDALQIASWSQQQLPETGATNGEVEQVKFDRVVALYHFLQLNSLHKRHLLSMNASFTGSNSNAQGQQNATATPTTTPPKPVELDSLFGAPEVRWFVWSTWLCLCVGWFWSHTVRHWKQCSWLCRGQRT